MFDIQGSFIVPPEMANQHIEHAYALSDDGEHIICRIRERGRTTRWRFYENPGDDFTPWNGRPELGRFIKEVTE